MHSHAELMQMLVWYSHSENGNGPEQWVDAAFGTGIHAVYRAEKIRYAKLGFLTFYAALDFYNRAKLVDAMISKYEKAAMVLPDLEKISAYCAAVRAVPVPMVFCSSAIERAVKGLVSSISELRPS